MNNTPITVFLIDDDEDDRDIFQLAVEDSELRVSCVTSKSGYQALSMLSNNTVKPDVIFLDLNMPEMDGRECLSELKKHRDLSHIPVVIFSTSSDPRDISETRELGAVHFITKPSKINELTQSIDHFILTQLHNQNVSS
jgi:CheY-like chemotaxis protein